MLAAPILINRSMTNYSAGVSGKGNIINPRWRTNKKRNGHLSPRSGTNIFNLPASRPPLFLIGHYPGIDSKESIPPAYVASRAHTTTLFQLGS